jgi:hypothetical protein
VSCPIGVAVGVGAAVGVAVGVGTAVGVGVGMDGVGVICGVAAVGVAVGDVADEPHPQRNAASKAASQREGLRKAVTAVDIMS